VEGYEYPSTPSLLLFEGWLKMFRRTLVLKFFKSERYGTTAKLPCGLLAFPSPSHGAETKPGEIWRIKILKIYGRKAVVEPLEKLGSVEETFTAKPLEKVEPSTANKRKVFSRRKRQSQKRLPVKNGEGNFLGESYFEAGIVRKLLNGYCVVSNGGAVIVLQPHK
jgi:hypothetical protein